MLLPQCTPTKWSALCQVWWCTPVTPLLGSLSQEDHEFESTLGYILSLGQLVLHSKTVSEGRMPSALQYVAMNIEYVDHYDLYVYYYKYFYLFPMTDSKGWHLFPLRYHIVKTSVNAPISYILIWSSREVLVQRHVHSWPWQSSVISWWESSVLVNSCKCDNV